MVAAARDRGAPFFLASGGLRQYVEAVVAQVAGDGIRDGHAWFPALAGPRERYRQRRRARLPALRVGAL